MSKEILLDHKNIWDQKPVIREIYRDIYERILDAKPSGLCLEVGGGSGWGKDISSEVVSTDIVEVPWVDAVADAQKLPFSDASFSSVIAVDVLHHIGRPKIFLKEASRVLKKGGRIVLVEPAITPLSWFFYHYFHEERVDMTVHPLDDIALSDDNDPFDSNQAISTMIFGRYKEEFADLYPEMKLISNKYFSLFAYPLSGGFQSWQLLPAWLARPIIKVEDLLLPIIGRLMAFRHVIVIEKI